MSEWISVKDRLPEPDDLNRFSQCLVWDGDEHTTVAGFFDCGWYHDGEISRPLRENETGAPHFHEGGVGPTVDATHWMPLPEPPEVE